MICYFHPWGNQLWLRAEAALCSLFLCVEIFGRTSSDIRHYRALADAASGAVQLSGPPTLVVGWFPDRPLPITLDKEFFPRIRVAQSFLDPKGRIHELVASRDARRRFVVG